MTINLRATYGPRDFDLNGGLRVSRNVASRLEFAKDTSWSRDFGEIALCLQDGNDPCFLAFIWQLRGLQCGAQR